MKRRPGAATRALRAATATVTVAGGIAVFALDTLHTAWLVTVVTLLTAPATATWLRGPDTESW